MCTWVDRILCPAKAVCSIVDTQDLVSVDAIVDEGQPIALCLRELFVVTAKQAPKYVVLQLG
jgi:hypothetical protein